MKPLAILLATATLALNFSTPATSQSAYDQQLMRLAEILGSVHFLRALCGEENGPWRAQMEALIETEAGSDERRAMLIASFNHGYRSFASVHTTCTESAVQAIELYMKEGEALSREIVQRYGN